MTRRWLVVCSGLLWGTSLAGFTWGDEAARPPSLAERVSAMSRSWKQPKQPANPGVVQASHAEPARAPQEPAGFPQIDPRSLIPTNLFTRRGHEQPSDAPARQPQPQSPQRTPSHVASQPGQPPAPVNRMARTQRMGTAAANNPDRNGFTLPGLGGARPGLAASADSDAPIARTPASRRQQLVEEYQDLQEQYQAATSSRRAPVEITDQQPVARSAGRPSPGIQSSAAEDLAADEFRRELSGMDTLETDQSQALEAVAEISDQSSTVAEESLAAEETTPNPSEYADSSAVAPLEPTPMAAPERSIAAESSSSAQRGWEREDSLVQEPARQPIAQKSFTPSTRSVSTRPVRTIDPPSDVFGQEFSADRGGRQLLVENQTPLITSDIRGPKQILVGREATYELRLQNEGQFGADEVVASVRVPSGAEVVNTSATRGIVRQSQNGAAGALEWHLQRLDAGASEKLEVRLIPRNSRPLELGMTWTTAPVGSRAVVEVQEPKLKINVSGPEEVMFGKPQLYRLTLSNPGTGVAENVRIELLPPGGGQGAVTGHRLGSLAAGATKSLEVELTPREAGKLQVKASASADGGLTTSFAKDIFCRKPELEVDWRGPDMTYAGTEATYFFRVRNPGTATANDVAMTVRLPDGVELVSASEGQSFNRTSGEVSWQVGTLNPGDDFYAEIRCIVNTPGENQLNVVAATAAGDLADSKRAETQVVALADLKLEVTDPTGPVPVGDEAIYEILVQNRGANSAQDVNIVGLFSDGLEPIAVEGAPYDVSDGRVAFHTIDSLPAGRQLVLRIRAKAVQAGTHVFRAEVLCRDLEIKLASEETTRFFDGASIAERSVRDASTRVR